MKFNIDGLFSKPSFNFLAYHGLTWILIFLAQHSALMFTKFQDYIDFLALDSILCFYSLCVIACTQVLTTLIWLLCKSLRKKTKNTLLFSILFFILFYIVFKSIVYTYTGQYIYGVECGFILLGVTYIIPPVFWALIIPTYFILRYREKKHNLVIETPALSNNKFISYIILIGTIFYLLICIALSILCITFTFW